VPRWITSTGRAALGSCLTLAVAAGALVPSGIARAATGRELFLTEYVEGSGTNQAVEIYNPTDTPISLSASGYFLAFFFDGDTTIDSGVPLAGILQPGGTWVVTPTNADAALQAKANQKFGTSWFTGNDAVALLHSGTAIDVVGQIGVDPGIGWSGGTLSTADQTLRRKPSVNAGDATGTDAFDPSVEWTGYPVDSFDGLGNVSERLPNAAIALTCPTSIATVEGLAASGGLSATDPDGTVTGLAVTAVAPSDPGSIATTGFTPASGPGVAAAADLTVGAATPAGTYTATVTATNSDASPQTASCDVAISVEAAPPPPPPASLDDLRAMLDADVADGSLNADKAGLLHDRLDRAAADLAAGRMDAYRAQLQAFGNQAAGLAPHWVTTAAADALREAASEVAGSN
jgi:uncharacterized protein